MENLFMCSICGLCRYNHDVIRAPRLSSPARIALWKEAIGENAIQRLLKTTHAFICIEHFDYSNSFDPNGKIKRNSCPFKIPDEELQIQENLFHDHKFFRVKLRQFSPELTLDTVCCSLCSQLVPRTSMASHAELHTPAYINLLDHLCDFHSKNPPLKVYPSGCSNCTNIQSKAAFELARKEADRCFPMFRFYINQNENTRYFTFTIESELRDEYLAPRQNRASELHEMIGIERETKKIKEEDFDEFEHGLEHSDSVSNERNPDYVQPKNEEMNHNELAIKSELIVEEPRKGMTLNDFYQQDKHPSFDKLIEICERTHSSSYFATTFNYFRTKRFISKEICEKNDTCERVEKLLAMDGRPFPQVLIDLKTVKLMDEEFGRHSETGIKFSTGYVFRIADRLKVHPDILRAEYRRFQHARHASRAKQRRISRFDETNEGVQDANLTTTHVALRVQPYSKRFSSEITCRLEDEYFKLGGGDCQWTKNVCSDVGKKLGLTADQVSHWMRKRKMKGDGLTPPERRHTFSAVENEILLEAFEENSLPTGDYYRDLAASLNLSEAQVSNFFMSRRTALRKEAELNKLRAELEMLTDEQLAVLNKRADEKTAVLMENRIELAKQLGMSYQLVTHWFEQYKKGQAEMSRRRSLRKRTRPVRFDQEETYEYNPEDDDTHDEEAFHSDYSEEL